LALFALPLVSGWLSPKQLVLSELNTNIHFHDQVCVVIFCSKGTTTEGTKALRATQRKYRKFHHLAGQFIIAVKINL